MADGFEVREFFNDYKPRRSAITIVNRLLATVPARYLKGMDSIVLTNQSGQPRRNRLGKVTSRKRREPQSKVFARYHYRNRNGLPWIELYVDKIEAAAAIKRYVPLIRTICFMHVLYHEIGHHIEATIRPEHREREDGADEWGRKLMQNHFEKQYWYLIPVRKPIGRLLKLAGEVL